MLATIAFDSAFLKHPSLYAAMLLTFSKGGALRIKLSMTCNENPPLWKRGAKGDLIDQVSD